MHIAAALLCDYAGIRENTLMVVSGGLTRLYRPELPAAMGVALALLIEVPPQDRLVPHELSIDILDPAAAMVGKVDGGFQLGPDALLDPDEIALAPIALDLRLVPVSRVGWHSINISIDSEPAHALRFKVVQVIPGRGNPMSPGRGALTH